MVSKRRGHHIEPYKYEVAMGKKLQAIFDFDTDVSYHVYNFGKTEESRVCCITIEASDEHYPFLHTNSDRLDHLRGPNSNAVARYAREKLKAISGSWFCARKGFSVYYTAAVEHFS